MAEGNVAELLLAAAKRDQQAFSALVAMPEMNDAVIGFHAHQCIDAIVLGVSADKLHESDLTTKIESGYQAIVSSGHLEPHSLPVEHLGFRRGLLNLVR